MASDFILHSFRLSWLGLRKWSFLTCLALAVSWMGFGAGALAVSPVPQLVKDINPAPLEINPTEICVVGNQVFYIARDAMEGSQLWVSDGTPTGARWLMNITDNLVTHSLTAFGGQLYLILNTGFIPTDLSIWRTDGTVAGTVRVTPTLFLGHTTGITAIHSMSVHQGSLYFSLVSEMGNPSANLWKSDGTLQGTVLLKNLQMLPGYYEPADSRASYTSMGSKLFILFGKQLWVSDGTAAGTQAVNPVGEPFSGVRYPCDDGHGLLYFQGTTTATGAELWRTDGTQAGTMLVKDVYPGPMSSSVFDLAALDGKVYFGASSGPGAINKLWRSDGTSAGTTMLPDVTLRLSLFGGSSIKAINQALYFNRVSPSGFSKYDGENLTLLASTFAITDLAVVGGSILFGGSEWPDNIKLWKTDGTAANTVVVKNLPSRHQHEFPSLMTAAEDRMYFRVGNGSGQYGLWKSDGTEAGTVSLNPPLSGHAAIAQATSIRDTLYFQAYDSAHGIELWKSDGTETGTMLVKDLYPGTGNASPKQFVDVNGQVFFAAQGSDDQIGLWKTDGTEAGTSRVGPLPAAGGPKDPWALVALGNVVYFRATSSAGGMELWKSDGTLAGTVLVKNVPTGNSTVFQNYLIVMNGALYFNVQQTSGDIGMELWKSDGTTAGTVRVKKISSGYNTPIRNPVVMGGVLYFAGTDEQSGQELWRSDGTEAGTWIVKDIFPGATGSLDYSASPVVMNQTLYFEAMHPVSGQEVWRSDGTESGTYMITEIKPGSDGSRSISDLTALGSQVYFTASDNAHGSELWRTDGTPSGTVRVKDIFVGQNSSAPSQLKAVGQHLYFTAYDNLHGRELWRSDGTEAGTVLVSDLWDGVSRAGPANLQVVGSRLLFSATTRTTGNELWSLDLTVPSVATAIYQTWAAAAGLTGGAADPQAAPYGEGVSNLMKYAFNLNGGAEDNRVLVGGTGTSGLPLISSATSSSSPAIQVLRMEYVRRIASGLTYTPMISSTLVNASWSPLTTPPTIEPIDSTWERVIYEVHHNRTTQGRRLFGRVRVTLP